MKKVVFIAVMASFVFFSCSKLPEQKAQTLIKTKLNEVLNDPKSYESVKFSKLDSAYTSLLVDSQYVYFNLAFERVNDLAKKYIEEAKLYAKYPLQKKQFNETMKTIQIYRDSMYFYSEHAKMLEDCFIPEFTGWKMDHIFRTNNAFSGKVLCFYSFYFDKDLSKIVRIKEVK